LLRSTFVLYGFITHDEGIAFYNSKLAYSGLIPFIDYNGWNSLVNDYLFGLPRLFFNPSFLSQRIYALLVSIGVFWLVIAITRWFNSRSLTLLTALFLTAGSLNYTYYSNIPYSEQAMTFFIVVSLFFLRRTLSQKNSFFLDSMSLITLTVAALVRSQVWPLVFILFFFLCWLRRYIPKYIPKIISLGVLTVIVLYSPFFLASFGHTIYALMWPLSAGKILLYVANTPPRSLFQLISFTTFLFRDYGLLLSLIVAGSFTLIQLRKLHNSPQLQFVGFCLLIIGEFFTIAIIHHPADASYLYPAVPIMAFLAAFFVDRVFHQIPILP
jgi:hypothetical protein